MKASAGARSIAILLIMGTLWGLQFAMLKLAVEEGYQELNVLMLALALISLVYAVIAWATRRFFRLNRARLAFFVITAVIGYLVPMAATLFAAPYIAAGVISLIVSLAPLFTFFVAYLLRTEAISRLRLFAMLLGLLSVALVLLPQAELPGYGTLPWMLLLLAVPFCYGVESIYVAARWPEGLDVVQVGLGEALAATILTAPLLLFFGEPQSLGIAGSTAEFAILVFVLCGVLEVFLYFYLIRTTGGVLVSFATFISLFAGIGWGMVIFAESHAPLVWLAVVILVGALILVTLDQVRAQAASS